MYRQVPSIINNKYVKTKQNCAVIVGVGVVGDGGGSGDGSCVVVVKATKGNTVI